MLRWIDSMFSAASGSMDKSSPNKTNGQTANGIWSIELRWKTTLSYSLHALKGDIAVLKAFSLSVALLAFYAQLPRFNLLSLSSAPVALLCGNVLHYWYHGPRSDPLHANPDGKSTPSPRS
jgi:hypothetical protein